MASISYGSITLVDITDVGELSVYPMSNLPLSVIYDPDQNSYTPNWGSTNLKLTPVIYYAGEQLTIPTTGLTITWQRQEGINGAADLTSGETISNGVLTVNANKFSASSTFLTYIVTAEYLEPTSQQQLKAQGQITFSLVKQASEVKTAKITGENTFKYNTSQTLVGASYVTLTAYVNNVSIGSWQYQKSDGTYAAYPITSGRNNSNTSTTLNVYADDATFVNDKCTIKLVTTDANTYDIFTVVKLRDGAAGQSTVAAVLTNEDQMVPADQNGNATSFDGCETQLIIYRGGTDETSKWTITTSASSGITYQVSTDGSTYVASGSSGNYAYVKVTGMTTSTGSITFTTSKSGETTLVKTFSLVKVKAGVDGTTPTVYQLDVSSLAVNKDISGTFTPSTVTVSAYSKKGNNNRTAYAGRFKITYNGTNYTSTSNESSYTIPSTTLAAANGIITVELYAAGGTTTLLDSQSIVITSDGETGEKGDKGDKGVDTINVVLGNNADVIPCTSNNLTKSAMTIEIPFTGYQGTSQIAATCTAGKLFGSITGTVTNATASASGKIVYSVPANTAITKDSGTVSLSFVCAGKTIPMIYSWTRSTAATNGVNAKLFELYAPNGDVFTNGEGSLSITGRLMDGSTDRTSAVSKWTWYKYESGSYTEVSDSTASILIVKGSTVDGYASYKCEATYSGVTYVAYYSLIDKTDPIQVSVSCSLGNQIVNGQGIGAIYVKVTRNGEEIDDLKSEIFSTSAPSNPTSGDFYYKLDSTNKTVTLMKYNGSSWAAATGSDLPAATYEWSYRDKDGNVTTPSGLATTGKVIYIDGSFINSKIIADVKVTI